MAHIRISAFLSRGERSGRLIIFDKDGTLIDFNAMWGGWIIQLARHLEAVSYVATAPQVDALAWGDDGRPIKPAPDAILALCQELGIAPAQAAMVGDTAADLRMGRAAGLGLNIGVLSGVGAADQLAPLADVLLPSVAG